MNDKLDKCIDGIHKIEVSVTRMEAKVDQNTEDLKIHIKRTDLLEKKLGRIYAAAMASAGFLAAKFGPDIIKLMGL